MINRQDFINAINKNIDMVRGDTLAFGFQLKGLGSITEYTDLEMTFSVAENYNANAIIEVTSGDGIELESYNPVKDVATFTVNIAPNMTKTLDIARYYYDLQFTDGTNVVTLMRGRLTLLYDVAD